MKTRRLYALIFSVLLLSQSLLACSDTTVTEETAANTDSSLSAAPAAEEETAPVEEEAVYISDDLPDADYDGYNYRILSCYFYDKELATYITYDEMTGDPVNDALYESQTTIEERFNVDITWIETGDTTAGQSSARSSITGGVDAFDILIGHDTNTFALGKAGLLLNLMNIEQFNFDKPWWPKNTVESLRIADRLYAASSYLSYCGLHWTRAIAVNKDFADDLGLEVPYEMVREGTWTLDTLYSMVEGVSMDINGNGRLDDEDKVGFTSGGQTLYCFQEACDVPIYRHDAEGLPFLDLDMERAEYYNEMVGKLFSGDDYLASGDFGEVLFQKGNTLFAYTQVGNAYDQFRLSEVRYGFLPSPKLNEIQENYINCCTDVPWAMPKTLTGEQRDLVGTITEAMSCYNYNHVLPAYYEGAIKSRIADAPDDTEMLQLISDTRTIGFGYAYGMPLNNFAGTTMGGGIASHFQSQQKVANKQIDRLISSTLEIQDD